MTAWLTVVGIGEDGYAGLGKAARRALLGAECIVGASRQLDLLPPCIRAARQTWPSPFSLAPVLQRRGTPTCVLASGEIDAELLERCRELGGPVRGDLTQLPGLLVARCLAGEALHARAWLIELWRLLRPALLGRAAVPPRIWST